MGKKSHQVLKIHIDTVENARQLTSLTHKTISERLGCTRQPISKFFNGKSVSCEIFINVCEMLDLDWQEIAGIQKNNVGNANSTDRQETENNIDGLVDKLREQVKTDIETRCGTMRILDMSQPIGLDDIYTKVNILEKISGRRRKDITELTKSYDIENFERFNFGQVKEKIPGKEAVSKYRTLLILGKPGAGKTTFLKHLVIQCSRGLFQGDLVPFFITLKEFAETEDRPKLFDYLYLYPTQYTVTKGIDSTDLQQILLQGKALICMDGLDEVLASDNKRVIKEIEAFVHKYPKNQYLMTCRIAAKEYTFTQFTEVEIADFDWEQITIFATSWFKNKSIKPEIFLFRLENDKSIQELASNPLLLTLLCLVFEELTDFPVNRSDLYKEGFNSLLKSWDTERGIQRDEVYKKLWIRRKKDLLSKIAWETFSQSEYFFKQDKAERYIGEYIRNLPGANTDEEALRLDSEAVLKSIESQHGLLVERAKGIYSFSHLTFQEYFAARQIIVVRQSSNEALEELVSHLFDKQWREVFLLAVAMSHNAERLVLLIKNRIDRILIDNRKIQHLLQWLNKKAELVTLELSEHDRIAIKSICDFYADNNLSLCRFFYFSLELECGSNLNLNFNLYSPNPKFFKTFPYYTINLNNQNIRLDLNIYLNYTCLSSQLSSSDVWQKSNHNSNFGLNIYYYLKQFLSSHYVLHRAFVRGYFRSYIYLYQYTTLWLAKEIDFKLFQALVQLVRKLPSRKDTNFDKFENWWLKSDVNWSSIDREDSEQNIIAWLQTSSLEELDKWWKENGTAWAKNFRNVMIEHRDIGHDWQFSDEQKVLLEQYYFANKLLSQCLHQGCCINPEVRKDIEETLLLPSAEIEKCKSNLSNQK